MKAQDSPFKIENIFITQSQFRTIPNKNSEELKKDLSIDIDFDIKLTKKDDSDVYIITVELIGNKGNNPIPGYFFNIVARGIFSFTSKLDKPIIDNYLLLSGLPLIINTVRGYILNVTSYFPYGKYIMSLVDLNSLIEEKSKEKSKEAKKEKK
jgi:preprotein translocase subunit SecB